MTKGKILWVDDEIDLLRPHIMLLEQRGYSVATANNGEDALAIAQEQTPPFDLVFLDEMMPGMGGLRTLELLKQQSPATPVVMLTGWGAFMKEDDSAPDELDALLSKPPRSRELRETLSRLLPCKPA